jgi:hypothetical protein
MAKKPISKRHKELTELDKKPVDRMAEAAISDLAKSIIEERTEEAVEEEKAIEKEEVVLPLPTSLSLGTFEEKHNVNHDVPVSTGPKQLPIGSTIHNPFKVQRYEREVTQFLESIFGRDDGDYMLLNERTTIIGGRRIKTMYIEDKNNNRYRIFADTSTLSMSY